jgi:hypothetical protein
MKSVRYTESLEKLGFKVIQVVEGTDYPPRNYQYFQQYPKAEEHYTYQIRSVDINHRIVPGYDDTYVTLLTERDIADLERLKQEHQYMLGIVEESNKILSTQARENKVRRANTGVEEAYQHYKFLLNLAE